jgi:pantoate--beta-alanine ligase
MYPGGYATYVLQERYTEAFEGDIRTGHFHGVCTVCAKLFNLVHPDIAFFGQKDYQQSVVIRRMVRDLNFDVKISVCPIVRESDGLAMSSRNVYLSPEEREQATALHGALRKAEELFAAGERRAAPLIAAMGEVIREAPLAKVDYIAVVNPETLREIRRVESEAMVLLAVRMGRTRLIDNCHLSAR